MTASGAPDGHGDRSAALLRDIATEFGAQMEANADDPDAVVHLAGLLADVVDVELADRGDLVFHPESLPVAILIETVLGPVLVASDTAVTVSFDADARGLAVAASRDHLVRAIRTLWFGLGSPPSGIAEVRIDQDDDRVVLAARISAPHTVRPLADRAARALVAVHGGEVVVDDRTTTVSLPLAPWSGDRD